MNAIYMIQLLLKYFKKKKEKISTFLYKYKPLEKKSTLRAITQLYIFAKKDVLYNILHNITHFQYKINLRKIKKLYLVNATKNT